MFSRLFSQILNKVRIWSSVHKHHLIKHVGKFANEIGHTSLALDIGSGDTPYKSTFDTRKYIAIDLSASNKVNVRGDICALPLQTAALDVVICTEVVEHVENVDKALEEINRVLKHSGHLVLTTPLLMGIHCTVDYHRFTETMLKILLNRHGFEIQQLEKRGGILSVLGAILLQVPRQVLGLDGNPPAKEFRYLLVGMTYIFLVPLAKTLTALDALDKSRNFTLGYDCLCKKVKPPSTTFV